MAQLEQNTINLNNIIDKINALPNGVDTSGVTATASDVLMYKKFVNSSGELIEGAIGSSAPADIVFTPNNDDARVLTGNKYYTRDVNVSVSSYTDIQTPIVPSTSDKYISSSSYGVEDSFLTMIKVKGDANLLAENIKSGVSIFGVAGTMESGSKVTSLSGTASTTSSGMGSWITYTNTITFNNTGFTTLPNNLWVMSNSNPGNSGYIMGMRWLDGSSSVYIYSNGWSSSSATKSFNASTETITLSISYTGTNYFQTGTWSGFAW